MVISLDNVMKTLERRSNNLLEGNQRDRKKSFALAKKWNKVRLIIEYQGGQKIC